MDLSRIKNLVKQNGDKFIFVENGEPEVVMMPFREYEKLANGRDTGRVTQSHTPGEGYGIREDDFIGEEPGETEFVTSVVAGSVGLPIRLEDIRLEDLPV